MKLQHLIINNDGMTGVDASLIAHHHICGTTQKVGDLSFSLVTPLSTDDDNVGQRLGGPKPRFCTIRDYLRLACLRSKMLRTM